MALKEISKIIAKELKQFDEIFKNSIRSKIFLVDVITKYILKQKGKKIRPLLVFLSSKLCGETNETTYRGAALVEILHTATLIHDDVVDEANVRRGLPSINSVWKNKAAVLMGDFLLAKGLLLSLDNDDFTFLKIMSDSVRRMSEGEILEIEKSKSLNTDEKTYFKIISDKTASLISTCCEIGAASSTNSLEYRKHLREFGENLGIAFQIRDDILDFIGKKNLMGKPTGISDVGDKKLTLPLIHAIKNSPKIEANSILKIIKNGIDKSAKKIIYDFVHTYKGIDYSIKSSIEFAEMAKSNLSIFPNSIYKQSLIAFTDFVVSRVS